VQKSADHLEVPEDPRNQTLANFLDVVAVAFALVHPVELVATHSSPKKILDAGGSLCIAE